MAYCGNCGSPIPGGVKFCPACGSPVQFTITQPVSLSQQRTLSYKKPKRRRKPLFSRWWVWLIIVIISFSVIRYRLFGMDTKSSTTRTTLSSPAPAARNIPTTNPSPTPRRSSGSSPSPSPTRHPASSPSPSPQHTAHPSKTEPSSFESIYTEYSNRLEEEYNDALKELDNAIAAKKDIDYLADLTDEKVDLLAEICDEGIEKMADKTGIFTTGDYMEWATKLTSDYMSYSTGLFNKYMSGSMGSIFN